ncbi:MAG: ABC transporter permease [Cyclobacteriaceae bacterium]
MEKTPAALRVGFRLLEWFCSIDHLDMVSGDLLELYNIRVHRKGKWSATISFYRECLSLIYQFLAKGKSEYHLNNMAMFKNYFLIGIRNLFKNRMYSLINIAGLALGIAGAIVIYQFIITEKTYDTQFSDSSNIVRITSEWYQDNEFLEHRAAAVPALEQIFDASYPEVKNYTRYHKGSPNVVRFTTSNNDEIKFEENEIYYADPSFLDIFDIDFIAGNPANALQGPNKVVITEGIASKYFGGANPIGQTLKFDGEFDFSCQVSGVVKDFDRNSHLAGNMIISLETKANLVPFEIYENWIWRSFYTYLVIDPSTDLKEFESKINEGVHLKIGDYYEQRGYKVNFQVQPLKDIHLHSALFEEMEVNGSAQTIHYLSIACLFLLLIAAFNYINLTTAKNLYRAKEVGIRKVVGAYQINLAAQYLIESLMVFGIAILLSLALIYFLYPIVQEFVGLDFSLDFLSNSSFWILLNVVWLTGGIVSGLYPALVLTTMKPTIVLKGSFKNSTGNLRLRKSLVIFQVALSLMLAISVLLISLQIQHMRQRDLGVRKENVLVINGPKVKDDRYLAQLESFKQQLERNPAVEYFSTVSSLVGEVTGAGRDFRNEDGSSQFLRIIRVEYDFDKVMEMATVAGHTFAKQLPALDSGLVLNEAATKQMGYAHPEDAVQRTITWRNSGDPIQSKIAGIVNDYYPSAQSEAVPTVFILNRTFSAPWDPEYYIVSLQPQNFNSTLTSIVEIEDTWKNTFTADPFNYYFMESFYNEQFKSEVSFRKILGLFGSLAILLSCVGILALASFSNFMRQKEIGLRKVLGSSEIKILMLLLKDYVGLVLIGAVIVLPLTYYVFSVWLSNFNYRIEMQLWHFLLPVAGLLLLVTTIISIQSFRIISINPIKVLGSD